MSRDSDPSSTQALAALAEQLVVAGPERLERLLAAAPEQLQTRSLLAQFLIERGSGEAALRVMGDAVRRMPRSAEALNALGIVHRKLGQHAEAAERFEQALALDPKNNAIRFNQGLSLLSQGDLEQGWQLYETGRNPLSQRADPMRRYPFPEWQGEPLDGKSLYLWAEQGVGDVILYSAMIAELQAQGARCTVECDERLIGLLRRSFPGLAAVAAGPLADLGAGGQRFDYHVPLGSLGRFLRPTLERFPAPRAFLKADRRRVAACRERLAALGEGTKVGISWFSKSATYDAKSTELSQWAPILRLPGCHFVNLQYGDVSAELDAIRRDMGISVFDDPEIDKREDLEGLTALASACDIVVTVSNVTAPIAGALGKRVLLMVGPETMWHWFMARSDSPWYPEMRIFRAAVPYVWDDIIESVAQTLITARASARPAKRRRKLSVRSRRKPS